MGREKSELTDKNNNIYLLFFVLLLSVTSNYYNTFNSISFFLSILLSNYTLLQHYDVDVLIVEL